MDIDRLSSTKPPSAWERTKDWLTRVDEALHYDPVEHLQEQVIGLSRRVEKLERNAENGGD